MTMTKAIRFHEFGGPEVLRLEDIDLGAPGPGQVLIRQTAIGMNFRDIYRRIGQHPVDSFPAALGIEGAGMVEALGDGVDEFFIGQRVVAQGGPDGAFAKARIVPAARAVALPDSIDDKTAAAMMVHGLTSRMLLKGAYKVQSGDTILFHAAAGGVGLMACQWAKLLGATVIGTVGTDEKASLARAHGCDHTIIYTREDFAARVKEITGGEGVHAVYDSVGKDTFEGSITSLRPRGVMAQFGESSGDPPDISPRRLGPLGSIFLTHPSLPFYSRTRAEFLAGVDDLFDVVGSGKVKVTISAEYPLAEVAQAQIDMADRKTTGSVILIP
jgi:NADPH:quinone reductase